MPRVICQNQPLATSNIPESCPEIHRAVVPVPPDLNLEPWAWNKLLGSALTEETIRLMEALTHHDDRNSPVLILPFFDRHGNLTDYHAARLQHPYVDVNGKEVKYVMPQGQGCRAYFPPLPNVLHTVNTPGEMLLITEGILKAAASSQAGIPCIGLMGLWNWVVGGSKPRRLIPDLDNMDWRKRLVLIVPDFDDERKPMVNGVAVELAVALSAVGADARIPRLPPGRDGGKFTKQAIDDFILRHGAEAWRQWVHEQLSGTAFRSVEEWRGEIKDSRMVHRSRGVINLDMSPTGMGKSFADAWMLKGH